MLAHLCYFLDVADGLETELKLTKGGHVPGASRGRGGGGTRGAAECNRASCQHVVGRGDGLVHDE